MHLSESDNLFVLVRADGIRVCANLSLVFHDFCKAIHYLENGNADQEGRRGQTFLALSPENEPEDGHDPNVDPDGRDIVERPVGVALRELRRDERGYEGSQTCVKARYTKQHIR